MFGSNEPVGRAVAGPDGPPANPGTPAVSPPHAFPDKMGMPFHLATMRNTLARCRSTSPTSFENCIMASATACVIAAMPVPTSSHGTRSIRPTSSTSHLLNSIPSVPPSASARARSSLVIGPSVLLPTSF